MTSAPSAVSVDDEVATNGSKQNRKMKCRLLNFAASGAVVFRWRFCAKVVGRRSRWRRLRWFRRGRRPRGCQAVKRGRMTSISGMGTGGGRNLAADRKPRKRTDSRPEMCSSVYYLADLACSCDKAVFSARPEPRPLRCMQKCYRAKWLPLRIPGRFHGKLVACSPKAGPVVMRL